MRDPSIIQAEVLKVAQSRGLDSSRLTPAQYKAIQMEVTTAAEKAVGAGKALAAAVEVRVMGRTVPDAVSASNEKVCASNACGMHRVLSDTEDACDACTCHGKKLSDKRKSLRAKCPKTNPTTGRPYWDNRLSRAQSRLSDLRKEVSDGFRNS